MSEPTTLRDQARKAVLRQYAQAHDAHSEQEHIAAVVALKGYRDELDDRKPEGMG